MVTEIYESNSGMFKLFTQAGRDVVACLNEAMERQGIDMRVSALVCCFKF